MYKTVCTFPSDVTVSSELACNGVECNAGRVIVVKIVDPSNNITGYYQYISVPCVRLLFFPNGQLLRNGVYSQCANANSAIAFPTCCNPLIPTQVKSNQTSSNCLFANEAVNYATAAARCSAANLAVCTGNMTTFSSWTNTCSQNSYMWTSYSCTLQIQVYDQGFVGVVDPAFVASGGPPNMNLYNNSSGNTFRMRWNNSLFPSFSTSCSAGCVAVQTPGYGGTCLCNISVSTAAVFVDSSVIPSPQQILSSLFVGAAVPSSFPSGTYSQCSSSVCNAAKPGVIVWLSSSNTFDDSTIFQLQPQYAKGPVVYFANVQSIVSIPGTSFSFRNPPNFMYLTTRKTKQMFLCFYKCSCLGTFRGRSPTMRSSGVLLRCNCTKQPLNLTHFSTISVCIPTPRPSFRSCSFSGSSRPTRAPDTSERS
jgi:hypothetical protein